MFDFGSDNRRDTDTFDGMDIMWQYRNRKSDYFDDLVLDSFACMNVSESRLHESIAEYQRMDEWN